MTVQVARPRPKVLHVVRSLCIGGLEMIVATLAKRLRESGFEQAVLCLESRGELADQIPEDIRVISCQVENSSLLRRHEYKAAAAVRQFRPDIIHANNVGAWMDAAFAWGVGGGRGRLAFTIHGWESTTRMPRRRAWICRSIARMTSGLIAVSPETADQFAAETGIPRQRFSVVTSGVDIERYLPRTDAVDDHSPLVIACVARFSPIKALHDLVRAFALLCERSPQPVVLHLIGDGPERARLEAEAKALNVADRVRFVGMTHDVPGELRHSDIFALSSLREGLPMSIMEAMAAGLPVVGTRVGSVDSLVEDGVTGLLVPASDPEALACALERLVGEPDFRRRAGILARQRAEQEFSLDAMAKRYASFYETLLRQ